MSKGKFFLFAGLFVVLLAIPVTIFYLQQQTQTQSNAAKSTTLSFSPTNTITVGQTFQVSVELTPNSNAVSFVKLSLFYDSTKLATASGGISVNTSVLPSVLDAPQYNTACSANTCNISVTMSTGASGKPLTGPGAIPIATLNFTALAPTDTSLQSILRFDQSNIQVLSVATGDQPAENVLATATDANITIGGVATGTPTDTPTPSDTPTPTTVSSDNGGGSTGTTATDTDTPIPTQISSSNGGGTGGGTTSGGDNSGGGNSGGGSNGGTVQNTPVPTLQSIPKTGPSPLIIGTGIAGTLVTIGGLLLLVL